MLRTADGGRNWTSLLTGISNDLYAAFCHSPSEIHVAGSGGIILKTSNAGSTWELQSSGVTGDLLGMDFPVDASTGYVVGVNGVVLKTTNGGQAWVRESTGTTAPLRGVCFPQDNSTGYAVGGWYDGLILKTANGGQSWNMVYTGWEDLWSISFGTPDTGFAVGYYGAVVKTTDAGNHWTELSVGEDYDLPSVYFPEGGRVGYAVGYDWWAERSVVWKTVDGGESWARQISIQNDEGLWSVRFIDNNVGYAVGGCGMILKTTDGGGIGVAEEAAHRPVVPNPATAVSCAPNPFSDRTTIELAHSLTGPGPHVLQVLNAAGRLVRSLAIESSLHSVQWDGSDDSGRRLPAGVYFVRLRSGGLRQEQKVMLLR
ncbi:MAG: YCF48-related protein [candidate division WOR-3 bacterium]